MVTEAAPATLAEARDAVLGGGALLFAGAGTKLDWLPPARACDTIVRTAGLRRLVAHERDDLTATVEAGMPLAELQRELAGAGQWLAVDPPLAQAGATVGGVFAADDAGPRRLRYGTLRDQVIGCTVVLSDGAVARSGGRVIKNVAGYDLMRPLCGSHGTLGLVTELTVRLHPLPERAVTLRAAAGAHAAAGLALRLLGGVAQPSAVDWTDDTVWVLLEGRGAGLMQRAESVRRAGAALGVHLEELDDAEAEASWAVLRELPAGRPGETVLRAATLPDGFGDLAIVFERAAQRSGLQVALHSHVALGLHTARLSGGTAAAHTGLAGVWREAVAGLGGTPWLRRRVGGVALPASDTPAAAGLMRRLKHALDPDGRCGPGRLDWLEAA
ncbi:MAG TPA: FAD-binding protein [Egibacteraceae bacterium]|nr:FAD-binding protein [Egibacteraceae bacterium]